MLLSFFMAEENSQSLQRKRRSTQDRLQFSFNVELPREQETRYFGIKDRIKMARSAMNLSKATSRTQNADLIEAMLLAFEEKMQRRSETLATLTRSSLSSPSVREPKFLVPFVIKRTTVLPIVVIGYTRKSVCSFSNQLGILSTSLCRVQLA